jgi:transposase
VLRSGAYWSHMPERYGSYWKSTHKRFARWARAGVWEEVFAHKKLVWCSGRQGRMIDFWVAFSEAVIIVRRLIWEACSRYSVGRPARLAGHDLSAQALNQQYPFWT